MSFELAITQSTYNLFAQSSFALITLQFLTNALWIIMLIYFAMSAFMQGRYLLIAFFVACTTIGFGLKELITLFFVRIRPYELIHAEVISNLTKNSFYSTHTFVAFIIAFYIFFLTKSKVIRIIAIILAIIVAFTRLALAQHYISDIFAGFLLALILYLITKAIYEKYFVEKISN